MQDPRALADIFEKAEADLAKRAHPDPYRRELPVFGVFAMSLISLAYSSHRSGRYQMVCIGGYLLCTCADTLCTGNATFRYVS